ncbi:FMN-binding protein [Streptomyces chiangmaiensis]|uniref:FMN-binding protein n=1 Tax=Streptomyces chiangmaiensis TaxID=766497 RepID=A0ABU7FMX5_9ACTN|nr:FMN-binding protein [Streptomyces chiangmaiensis]MED7825476.1 FMN-binding protein [Streptomyces chiangmaiensis]
MHALKRKSPLRRIVLASAATVSGMVLLLSMKPHTTPRMAAAGPAPSSSASVPAGSGGSGDSSRSGGAATAGTKTATGDSVQTRYGPVQVRIKVKNGKLTDATAVTYPQESPRDQEINSYAVPQLRREALAAQSANIDMVSGATYTSQGYQQSLQSALDSVRS